MKEIDVTEFDEKEANLYLFTNRVLNEDIIFKLGRWVIGYVDCSNTRHFDYTEKGIFFDANEFYNSKFLESIKWSRPIRVIVYTSYEFCTICFVKDGKIIAGIKDDEFFINSEELGSDYLGLLD